MADFDLPAGVRFSPSEEEAVRCLKRKILKQELPSDVVPTVDVYSFADPRQIPLSEFELGPANEWHFFTNKREENLIKTANGCWEERGAYEIIDDDGGTMGFTRILDFHYSNPKHMEKEEWYIHEYRADPAYFAAYELVDDNVKEKISNFVLCKVVCEIPSPKPPTNSCSAVMCLKRKILKDLNLPSGFRFRPSAEVCLKEYLKRKILDQKLPADIIPTVDIYSCGEPQLIPFYEFKEREENEWHFFTNRRKENPIKTTHGCWEEIHEDKEVLDGEDGSIIGFTRELVFKYSELEDKEEDKDTHEHGDHVNFIADELVDDNVGEKVISIEKDKEWHIHEHRANPANFTADELLDDNVKEKMSNFVLCKVFSKDPYSKPPPSSSLEDDAMDGTHLFTAERERQDNTSQSSTPEEERFTKRRRS